MIWWRLGSCRGPANFLGGAASNIGADRAQQVAQATDAAISVIVVPLQIFAAVALFRLGQILRRQSAAGRSGGEGRVPV